MKLLVLAPQPFFIERGTPIAVRLLSEQLSSLSGKELPLLSITLLTYSGGTPLPIDGVTHERIHMPECFNAVSPGISVKKVVCDLVLAFKAVQLLIRHRKEQFDLIHAVEESVFIALLLKFLFGIPYVYDMDSCLSNQIVEKWPLLTPLSKLFGLLERWAIRQSLAVVAVCESLAEVARAAGHRQVFVLTDISLLEFFPPTQLTPRLRARLKLPEQTKLLIYVGNLEHYQGIDLLLESFAKVTNSEGESHVVIVGGSAHHITHYTNKARALQIDHRVHFVGSAPLAELGAYMAEADLLLSPRICGNNTPMKIYSYLDSGKPVVATNLQTHTQVLTNEVSFLAEPTATSYGSTLVKALHDDALRREIGANAKVLAQTRYTTTQYRRKIAEIYSALKNLLKNA